MFDVTKFDITKLPRWAQERIRILERERAEAIGALNRFMNSQTVTPIFYEDFVNTGEKNGPISQRRYMQTNRVTFRLGKEEIEVTLRNGGLEVSAGWNELHIVPQASNVIKIEENHGR